MTALKWMRATSTGAEAEMPVWGSHRFTVPAVVVSLLLLVLALTGGMYVQSVIGVGCAYLVAALGYNLILGYSGQMAFCQAAFMAVGAYVLAVLEASGVPQVLAICAALLASAAVAAVIGTMVLRTREVYLALVTLAFAQAIIVLIDLWPASQGDNGIAVTVFGNGEVYFAVALAAASLLLTERLARSRFGRAMAMVRADEEAAAAMGVPAKRIRLFSFVIGGLLGGAGGVLMSGSLQFIAPSDFGMSVTLLLLTMIVVGGLASVWGTVLGVGALVVLAQYLTSSLGYQDIIYGAVLFGMLLVLPKGIVSIAGPVQRMADLLRRGARKGEHR